MTNMSDTCTGRFAPSPTGLLHFGSLLAAVASYCDARSQQGRWLVRMEDLDPPREMPGASGAILKTLETYGFEWDGPVLFQSTRHDAYEEAIRQLHAAGHLFWCCCSRSQLASSPLGIYPGTCRPCDYPRENAAIRFRCREGIVRFEDRIFGPQQEDVSRVVGDFVIKRRDGLHAYQLAVVVDDAWQGVTQVVRGADLLDNTFRQIQLQEALNIPTPGYAHLPLATNALGEKLSKQTYARALPDHNCEPILSLALTTLGHPPPVDLSGAPVRELLDWACAHWELGKVPATPKLPHIQSLDELMSA